MESKSASAFSCPISTAGEGGGGVGGGGVWREDGVVEGAALAID